MRIFVLGAGATGSLLAQLLLKQGHDVWCGDRDPDRARRFLGKKTPIPIETASANLFGRQGHFWIEEALLQKMPLSNNAIQAIRDNLERIRDGERVKAVTIGTLTEAQLAAINASRKAQELGPVIGEVLFVGGHIYKSRILKDGYTIGDVLDQITSAMDAAAVVIDGSKMTGMKNHTQRADRYGNQVKDEAIFECSTRHPRPELFSIVPKGDKIKPNQTKEATLTDGLSKKWAKARVTNASGISIARHV